MTIKNELAESLIAALRMELMESGEFLARVDDLRSSGPGGAPARAGALVKQRRAINECSRKRKRLERQFAGRLARQLPRAYRVLVSALAEENADLLRRVEAASARAN